MLVHSDQFEASKNPDGTFDYSPTFQCVRALLKDADYTVGNLETTLAGAGAEYTNALCSFNTPDIFADVLADAGFNMLSTGNNHCLDRGVEGLRRTLDVLDAAGLEHVGTARTPEEAEKPFIRRIGGISIGFISSTYGTNADANRCFLSEETAHSVLLSMPQESLPGSIRPLDPMETIAENVAKLPPGDSPELAQIRKRIAAAKAAGAEYLICLMHSGGQYNPEPDAYTEMLVGKLIEYGADMIVGLHPHIIQKCGMRKGIPVFYCLGNFLTSDYLTWAQYHPEQLNSILLKPVLRRIGGKVVMTRSKFSVTRSIRLPDGKWCAVPLYEQMMQAADPKEKDFLAAELERSVRTFLDLPDTANPGCKPEYDLEMR